MNMKPEEITAIIKKQIEDYNVEMNVDDVGTVLEVGDGIAHIYGLEKAMSGELLELPHGVYGMALNLEEDNVGAVLLGDDALIKEVDYNPLKGFVEEIDFQALVSSEKVHSSAEIHLLNESKLVAGIPQQMLHEINYKALPASLVEKIELDVGDLKIGDTIRVKDLVIAKDENIDLITDLDSTVVTVTEPRVSTDVTSETEEAAE